MHTEKFITNQSNLEGALRITFKQGSVKSVPKATKTYSDDDTPPILPPVFNNGLPSDPSKLEESYESIETKDLARKN